MKDPKLFREMSAPFESADAANEAVKAFFLDFSELRKKHKLANAYLILSSPYVGSDGEEQQFMISGMRGDLSLAEAMTAYAFGIEQADRQERISKLMTNAMKLGR